MDRQYFVANWKSHFTTNEAEHFLIQLQNQIHSIDTEKNVFIICPSLTMLEYVSRRIKEMNLPVLIGAQNLSPFPEGAYTGEVFAGQIKEYAQYVIIGHSERRKYNHETDDEIMKKAEQARSTGIKIIQCIQDENTKISEFADIIAYEPPSAISTFGTGVADDPEDVRRVLDIIDRISPSKILLYGGSVNTDTIGNYARIEKCSGFLIGSASLDAIQFLSLPASC